jgi:hypothetical protein
MANNPTAWPSAVRNPELANVDLLGEAIKKGRQRGLKVYAWHFTMNFGHTYAQTPEREAALAMNGRGQNTTNVSEELGVHAQAESQESHVFIDPYSPQARKDYNLMISEVLKRQPDGMLFDYVRYLRGVGPASVVSNVEQLWIYLWPMAESQRRILRKLINSIPLKANPCGKGDRSLPPKPWLPQNSFNLSCNGNCGI